MPPPAAAAAGRAGRTAESLLDHADLSAVRALAAQIAGPFASVAAALVAGGALEHDPAEPEWPDRDRVVVGDPDAAAAVDAALAAAGHAGTSPPLAAWEALPRAVGLAAASRLDGGVFRIWCLLGAGAAEHGAAWEAARVAVLAGLDTLVAVAMAPAADLRSGPRSGPQVRGSLSYERDDLAALLEAAGWRLLPARRDRPEELLTAFDHAAGAPTLVVVA